MKDRSLHQALAEHGLSSVRLEDLGITSQFHHRSVRTITRDGVPIELNERGEPTIWSAKRGWELIGSLESSGAQRNNH